MLAQHLEDLKADRKLRRKRGSYYTPNLIAQVLLDLSLKPILARCDSLADLSNLRIYDPACGTGAFLLPALVMLRDRAAELGEPRANVGSCLFGTDISAEAVEICRAELSSMRAEHFRLDVSDALASDWRGEFDLVVGNPPFGCPIQSKGVERSALGQGLGGTADVAYTFFSMACQWAKPADQGGKVAMVLPRAFLNARSASQFRASPPSGFQPEAVVTVDEAQHFEGANVYTCLVVLGDGSGCRRGFLGGHFEVAEISGANWWASSDGVDGVLLGDHFQVRQSLTVDEAYRLLPAIYDGEIGPKLLVTGIIDPGVSHWGTRTTRYLKTRFQRPSVDTSRIEFAPLLRRVVESRRPKVVVAGLSRNLEAYLDSTGEYLGSVSTFTITHLKDDSKELENLCDHLNSQAATDAFHRVCGSSALGGGSITVRKDFLQNLTLPESFSKPST